MNTIEILNSLFILPAIKSGIRERIWDNEIDEKLKPIQKIWQDLELIDNNNKLTDKGYEVYDLIPLIDYYLSLKDDFFNFSIYDNYTASNDQYNLLREGLQVFHKHYNSNLFEYLDLTNKEWNVLDYGGGTGQYLIDFIKQNPRSKGLLIDRNIVDRDGFENKIISKAIDFENNLEWYEEYEEKFNLIVLSEVLHCKNKLMREYLIDTCWTMLKQNGLLLINEIIPCPIFDWRMSMYTNGGRSISIEDIRELTKDQWEEKRYVPDGCSSKIKYHYQVIYKVTNKE